MSYYTLEILKKGQSAVDFLTASGNEKMKKEKEKKRRKNSEAITYQKEALRNMSQ